MGLPFSNAAQKYYDIAMAHYIKGMVAARRFASEEKGKEKLNERDGSGARAYHINHENVVNAIRRT